MKFKFIFIRNLLMRVIVILLLAFASLHADSLKAQTKTAKEYPGTPFQGTKEFCSSLKPVKFKIAIKGLNVSIKEFYNNDKPKTVKGIYKKGKVYTDDPLEKQFNVAGRLYAIYPTSFGINNLEAGDYTTYGLCRIP
jgi:hypothetical protein